ncbi:cysteine hydrolase family protein [Vibrio coralliilyticus]|uniref:cysteine hydrolase family protein n=1 Tax=Vibrio coralliilyticus TaxID=190893 RepID=UPI001560033C|nr:isochorismatase family cysteine hydrolase [Vibrio coralliilyticus]NRF62985.1 cysteine hydrolase [Vibrio coralliilyticus]
MSKAILIIDLINDIVHPDGKIPSCARLASEMKTITNTNHALNYARKNNWLVVHIKVGFDTNYSAQPKSSPIFGRADQDQALQLGSFGTEFHSDVDVRENESIIVKPRISAFYNTSLEATLRANHVKQLYLAGVSTEWAIQSTAREGHDRDYKITILEDCCAASSKEAHSTSLAMLSRIADIVTASNLSTEEL